MKTTMRALAFLALVLVTQSVAAQQSGPQAPRGEPVPGSPHDHDQLLQYETFDTMAYYGKVVAGFK
jgi:hypothetical protein